MLPDATESPYSRVRTPRVLADGVRDDCTFYFLGDRYQDPVESLGYWKSNCELAAYIYNVDNDNFVAWNSLEHNITDPACSFEIGKWYCGSWNLPSYPTLTFTETETTTTTGTAGPTPPAPTHSGQPENCNTWHVVESGDSCQSVADAAGITLSQFLAWNPAVSSDCVDNFWLGQAYCVGVSGEGATTTTAATTASPTPPAPTHSGQPSNCNKWDVVESGDSCASLAADNGISLAQFFEWNPAVSEDCTTNFWLGQAYCVGVSGQSSSTTTTSAASPTPPAPTHTGQPSDCNKWDVVESGDTCGSIASDNGISLAQFFAWNPAVSEDCTTNFWLGQAYCVGVSGSASSTTSTSTSTTTAPQPPASTHTGQPSNCNKWDVVESGDSCASLASDNGITLAQFFAWNPAVSQDCVNNFWLGYAYCVGVSSP
jgi:LysM repeat protein